MKKILPVLLGLALAGVGFFAYTMFLSGGGSKETPADAQRKLHAKVATEKKQRLKDGIEGQTVAITDPFTVNLADRGTSWFSRFSVTLTYDIGTPYEKAAAEGATTGPKPEELPQIRSIITGVVNGHTSTELATEAGWKRVEKEIVAEVNRETAKTVVLEAYVTDWNLQQA